MPATEKSVLTAELRLDVQEFYARYAECLDGGRLQQWPEFFLESCVYRITTRRNLRLGPEEDLVYLSARTGMIDRIVAIGQSEDYEPHTQRHTISKFRIQAGSRVRNATISSPADSGWLRWCAWTAAIA